MAIASLKSAETSFQIISPVDGSVVAERAYQSWGVVDAALAKAKKAQHEWQNVPMAQKQQIMLKFLDAMLAKADEIGRELTMQMGRPIAYSPFEIKGAFQERVRYMVDLAPKALVDVVPEPREGFKRYIRREPVGVVFIIAPWNYPYITTVNAVVPALLAGNTVILKHAPQTALCADRFMEGFRAAGLPDGVFQFIDMTHDTAERMIADPRVDFVNFTGSVRGGHAIQKAASGRFINTGLELGGKDAAYVRPDAHMQHAIENIVDGACFNSGQSCAGIERVYVHEKVYDQFVDGAVELTKKYILGNPLDAKTTLGPLIRTGAADFVRQQMAEAVQGGAKVLIDEKLFPASKQGTPYLAPQVLVNVNHSMRFMREETFGPAVGIMKVKSDEEALQLMNDSVYGLTASFWTKDLDVVEDLGRRVEAGTVFMNRCDYVDPGLPWTGVKDTGKGASLSVLCFEYFTRPKGFHLRTKI